jgi:hypothetical protein
MSEETTTANGPKPCPTCGQCPPGLPEGMCSSDYAGDCPLTGSAERSWERFTVRPGYYITKAEVVGWTADHPGATPEEKRAWLAQAAHAEQNLRRAARTGGTSEAWSLSSCALNVRELVIMAAFFLASKGAAGELACRPGSVHPLARAGGHPSGTAVAGSLVRSTREHRTGRPQSLAQSPRPEERSSLLTLLRVGFTEPPGSLRALVVSYTAVSPLPPDFSGGGLFSVALSRGSPRVGVTDHPALRSPDLPRRVQDVPGSAAAARPARPPLQPRYWVTARGGEDGRCRSGSARPPGRRRTSRSRTARRHPGGCETSWPAGPASPGRPVS